MEMFEAYTEMGSQLNVRALEKGSTVKISLLVCNFGDTVQCGSLMVLKTKLLSCSTVCKTGPATEPGGNVLFLYLGFWRVAEKRLHVVSG